MYTHLLHSYILNFLALTDIKDFGRMQLFTMLLLIDLALLFTPKMFLFSIYHYFLLEILRKYYED